MKFFSQSPQKFLTSVALLLLMVLFPGSWVTAVEPKGEVVVAQPNLRQHFNAMNQVAMGDWSLMSMLFDGLINLGPDGIYPALATGRKISEDGLIIDLNLRQGVKFHNGDAFSAEDVKFTYDYILFEDNTHGYKKIHRDHIERVEILGPYEIRFHMKKPWASMWTAIRGSALLSILPKNYYTEVGPEGFAKQPVGTGPYKLVDLKTGEFTKFEAHADYWDTLKPTVKYITTRLVKEPTTRYAMLVRGEADIIKGVTGPLLKKVKETPEIKTAVSKYIGTTALHFHRGTNPEFKDRRVRLAAAHAINFDRIAETILGGQCQHSSQFFTPGTFGHNSDLKPIPYDPEKAKQLFTEAGLKPGHKVQFMMHAQDFSTLPNMVNVQEAMMGHMSEIGFEFTRHPHETGAWLAAQRAKKQFGMFYGPSTIPLDGGGLMSSFFQSWSIWSGGQVDVTLYDAVYEKASMETNPEKRARILSEYAELERYRVEAVPMFWCDSVVAYGPRIKILTPGRSSLYHMHYQAMRLEE